MGIIVAALFILLLVCFYFIALLNMKINRFQNNERKNEVLFEEMEASISSFLTDIEDENTRLIQSLKKTQEEQPSKVPVEEVKEDSVVAQLMEKTMENESAIQPIKDQVKAVEQKQPTHSTEKPGKDLVTVAAPITYGAPKYYVKNAYQTQKKEKLVQTVEERVYEMYARGQTISAIAKELGKGKVEVELLLKFNNKNT